MKRYESVHELIDSGEEFIGKYIRFEGNGIISGLSGTATKSRLNRVLGIDDEGSIIVKKYNRKINSRLISFHFNQACEIYTQSEQRKLNKR